MIKTDLISIADAPNRTWRAISAIHIYGTETAPGAAIGAVLTTTNGKVVLVQGCPFVFSSPQDVTIAGYEKSHGTDLQLLFVQEV